MNQFRGIRGATTSDGNCKSEIEEATLELLQTCINANDVEVEDIAAAIFTVSQDITEYNQLCHWSIAALHWNDLLTEGLFSDNGRFRRDTVALALCLYTRIDRSYDHHLFIRREFIP